MPSQFSLLFCNRTEFLSFSRFFHFHFSQQIALVQVDVHSSGVFVVSFPYAATFPWIVSGDNVNDTAKLTGEFISRQSREKEQKREIDGSWTKKSE